MDAITLYIISAVLFVLGLAAIGGAAFGRAGNRRLILAVAGVVLWAITLLIYQQAASPQAEIAVSPSTTPTKAAAAPADTPEPPTATPEAPEPDAPGLEPSTLPDIPGRIAFHSGRTGNLDIWLMNANGTGLQQLTHSPERDIEPAWSPDGQKIVFTSGRDNPQYVQLYVMDGEGNNQQPLMPFSPANQLSPRWSPDGEWVVFFSNPQVNGQVWFDIYKVRSDGAELTNLSNTPGNNFMPDWSPDGSRIVFTSERDGNRELYVMNADGSNQVQITDSSADEVRPRWSSDGNTIIFESNRDGTSNIYKMDAPPVEGAMMEDTVRLLTFPGFNDVAPDWAVNGEMIVFGSDRDAEGGANWEVYIMDADGDNAVRLTNDPEIDRFGAWTP